MAILLFRDGLNFSKFGVGTPTVIQTRQRQNNNKISPIQPKTTRNNTSPHLLPTNYRPLRYKHNYWTRLLGRTAQQPHGPRARSTLVTLVGEGVGFFASFRAAHEFVVVRTVKLLFLWYQFFLLALPRCSLFKVIHKLISTRIW